MEEQTVGREQLRLAVWSLGKRIALLAVLAVVVVGLRSLHEYLGASLVVFFLALTGIYLVRCAYALLRGFIDLASGLIGGSGGSSSATWLLAGMMLNAVEVVVCLSLAIYVLQAAGWSTDIRLPDPIPYQLP